LPEKIILLAAKSLRNLALCGGQWLYHFLHNVHVCKQKLQQQDDYSNIHIPVNLGSVAEEVIIEEFVGGEDLGKNNYQVSNLNTMQ
jgi:hypothetical protein